MATRKNCQSFSNLEKSCPVQNQIRTIFYSEKEILDEKEVNTELFKLYKGLFKQNLNVSNALIQNCLKCIEILEQTKE